MPAKTRAILRRVNSVTSTRKITRAMEMVASAKLKGAQRRATELKAYAKRLQSLLKTALSHPTSAFHPLLQARTGEKTAVVLITSDKGLCGAYNSNVIKAGMRLFEESGGQGGFISVGNKGRAALRRSNLPLYRELQVVSGAPSFQCAQKVTEAIVHVFQERTVDRVQLVFTDFVNAADQRVEVLDLLPFSSVVPERVRDHNLLWEPSPQAVMDRLIPEYLGTMVYRALLESTASEFAARRVAMKNATDNASDMIDSLTLEFNRARQAAITQEIAEIVGGAEALD